ncbi:MAG: type VI secretion system tip protein VgrG [bacterium]|nr:type VI secretion system tip protein VgrG [bacterium]
MSAVTPTIVTAKKAKIDPALVLISIDVRREVDRIPYAELLFQDGDAAQREFALSDSGAFDPGEKIELKVRYEGESDETIFKGLVVRHAVEARGGDSVLVVHLKDAAVKLTGTRKSAVYNDKTDDKIIGDLLAGAKDKVDATTVTHKQIVQYSSTDWDFILSRADVNGLIAAVVDDGKVSVRKLPVTDGAEHEFEFGIDEILELEMEADAGSQFGAFEGSGWNLKDQKVEKGEKADSAKGTPGDLDGGKIAKAVGFEEYALSHPVPVEKAELDAWAKGRMARNRMAMVRGRIAVPGKAKYKLLDQMKIKGVGKRFNGKALITGVRHRVERGRWRMDLQFGLSPEWLSRKENLAAPPSAGLLPPVGGLQIGIVDAFEEDPDGELRVKIILPGVDEKEGKVWARLAAPDAGKDRGFYFRPEPDDEVVVGFFNDDPRHPVILGALYGSKNKPHKDMEDPSEENPIKAVMTKKGTALAFIDDDKPSFFIETPAHNKIFLSDDEECVHLSDQHENSLVMNKDGIEITSAKNLTIDASGGDVVIKGKKVDVK